ncbi:hypothetical protein DSLPV1_175 [Dishui lake phycodnavirus 1]|uniref:hypothetical protein n=1 Tax=Dishui lake phycodnavirus 1 TaxID=2079134 RepID=UPI000CD67E7E|nr:hypothetical protein C5Y57_gp223 [Dishui lake phycodnavirus 1]AUT19146.1 hypothetical protein DSLPV1_175 [Dishui lake phycodnavirus 1]
MRIEARAQPPQEVDANHHRCVRPVELHRVPSCPVCYEQAETSVVFRCGHELCVRCLKRWVQNCPVCRSDDHLEFVDEDFVDAYDDNLKRLTALSDDYTCRVGVFACASNAGLTIMQLKKI